MPAYLLVRDALGAQLPLPLARDRVSVGRTDSNDVALPWDTEVSRLHAELELIAGEWTVVDDGLSTNGTFVNGRRISGRTRLRAGDVIRVGATTMTFRGEGDPNQEATEIAAAPVLRADLAPTARSVLEALARPYKTGDDFATPATNQSIADELHLSVDAVKGHLRVLFQRFGIEDLPQNVKRHRLVAEALRAGVVNQRDL